MFIIRHKRTGVFSRQPYKLDCYSLLDRWQVCHLGSPPVQLINSLTIRARLSNPSWSLTPCVAVQHTSSQQTDKLRWHGRGVAERAQ